MVNPAVNKKTLQDKISKEIARLELTETILSEVLEILRVFDGKKYTKRITDKIKFILPGKSVYFENRYGMYHLNIWGNGIDYEKRIDFFLGYQSSNPNKIVDMNFIGDHNKNLVWIERELERLPIDLNDLDDITDSFSNKLEEVIKWKESLKKHSNIVYSEFHNAMKINTL